MTTIFLIDLIGWVGALLVLVAYGLISARKTTGHSLSYQGMNFLGGIFLLINTMYYGALPSSFLNLIWAGIAVYALVGKRKQPIES